MSYKIKIGAAEPRAMRVSYFARSRPLSIGIVQGEKATVPDPWLRTVLDHMLAKRPVRELWMVRDVLQRDAVTAWGKSAGLDTNTAAATCC